MDCDRNSKELSNDKKKGEAKPVELMVIPLRTVLLFVAATLTSALLIEVWPTAKILLKAKLNGAEPQEQRQELIKRVPKYAVYGRSSSEDHLIHVLNVLQRLGLERTTIDDEWDLLWAHDYPFLSNLAPRLKNLQQHQMVNHFPGCGFITNKVDLSTSKLPFLPRAFRMPSQRDEFIEFARENPSVMFVEKNNEHRNIAIKSVKDINVNANDTFVQEFINKPYLVDGYKFDIGVYVLITSVQPLRVHMYGGDVLFRYCPVKYYPFDAANVDKYVVGDDYLPTWEVPSLVKYYHRFGGSMRAAFDAYVSDQGKDASKIWPQVEDVIRKTILSKESQIESILRSYKTRNFFDLMRFDLIIDENLKVHLMEANMSPNLSSAHFKPNALLYEQILYSALNMLGIGSPVVRSSFEEGPDAVEEMITGEKNLATHINECVAYNCDKSCNNDVCDLCLPCVSGNNYDILERAHREQLHRGDMKRIFPSPINNPESFDLKSEVQNMSKRNAWMTKWFYGKCLYQRSWCN